jgi:glutathione S-transferase
VVGVELTRNRKDKTPFGQLPFLEDGEVKIAQSMAIARYLARKYKLDGET